MSVSLAVWLFIVLAIISANLPWFSERFLFVFRLKEGTKPFYLRLLEWLLLYFLTGLLAAGLEKKITGEIHTQDWEFYAVGFFLFLVFASPGVIYRYELKKHLDAWHRLRKKN
ncbi:MAG TPA: DUF2818 family protein [Gammaproteobacteria bacterium]|nr:DUF2818 family protein [Gammaproteobacteria bacterium]